MRTRKSFNSVVSIVVIGLTTGIVSADEKADLAKAQSRARRYLRRAKSVGNSDAKMRIVADKQTFEAGKPIRVGIHFSIASGWHIYSAKAGDGYLPTNVKLSLSDGAKLLKTEWPKTKQFEGFPGYGKSVMAIATILPGTDAKDLQLTADATWQVCNDEDGICKLGKGKLQLKLAKGDGKASNFAPLFVVPKK